MRAVRLHEYGDVDRLRFEDVPVPEPGAGEILVRIAASTVNPIDWRMRSGSVQHRLPLNLPLTLGGDLAGTVAKLGAGVTTFNVGDDVFGYCGVQRDGSYAEYIALPAAYVTLKPRSLTMFEAAAVPLGSLTSYVAMIEDGQLAHGQSVLIHAAAGSVGSMGVQLAKDVGATVYATGSTQSASLIKSLGADVVIDYRTQRFEEVAQNVDVVLDTMGGEIGARSWASLRPGGFMAAVSTPPDTALMQQYRCRGTRSHARPDGELLRKFGALVDAGKLRPIVARVMPLSEVREAHRLSEAGHVHGKLVLDVSA